MMKKLKQNNGVIALEASIVLSLFIFLIMFLYSFFIIYDANGVISHATIQAAESMSIDAYATNTLTPELLDSGQYPDSVSEVFSTIGLITSVKNDDYVSTSRWFNDITEDDWYNGETSEAVLSAKKSEFLDICERRFYAYLSSTGDEASANTLMNKLNVIDGTNGLDFSESFVDSNGNITIKVTYKVKFLFNFNGLGINELEFTQSATSHIWK